MIPGVGQGTAGVKPSADGAYQEWEYVGIELAWMLCAVDVPVMKTNAASQNQSGGWEKGQG